MIRVGLNLLYLVPGETGGTETYARALVSELLTFPGLELTAFINRETEHASDHLFGSAVPAVTVPVWARDRLQWVRGEQLMLPGLAARAGIDVLHSLANTAPARGRFRRVTTIHDLHFRRVPEAHLGLTRYGMSLLVPLAARLSHRVIAPSEATGHDVASLLRVPGRKIDVVPEGGGRPMVVDPMPENEVRELLHAGDRRIVLSVSAKRPHKNVLRLIEAVARIPEERRPLLAVPGYPTPYEEQLRRRADELRLAGHLRLLGWVSPAELEGMYRAATCLVCPSLHEGFGLPVLEAMARGLPVACSAGGALAEVAGDAALIFDPTSVQQISAAIERLIASPEERERLRLAGRARVVGFSWSRAAELTVRSYERALGSRA